MKVMLLKGILSALSPLLSGLLMASFTAPAMAGPVIDTTLWTPDVAPSSGLQSTQDGWTRLAQNTPTRPSNASGSLISDFSLFGDFRFTGSFSPLFDDRVGSSCANLSDPICNDNDILGLVFGWQNADNHYRLGFGQGGVNDITGRQGLFLIREVDDQSTTLASWDSSYWVDDASYRFAIERKGEALSVSVTGRVRSTPGTQGADPEPVSNPLEPVITLQDTVLDSAFLNGRIGVYTESQASEFGNFVVEVPTPGSLSLVALGMLGFMGRGFRRRASPHGL